MLFPFYGMTVTEFKPDIELYDYSPLQPPGRPPDGGKAYHKLALRDGLTRRGSKTTILISVASTFLSARSAASVRLSEFERLRFIGSAYVGMCTFSPIRAGRAFLIARNMSPVRHVTTANGRLT